ncbi:hypothetical protein [Protaetiibacter larvae]|uniref:hypothetical protein n=1 Tax=Protaetiibacter larvae TaxID=2592654 RepID=UPI001AEF3B16|nr:hypothetical protein [Protaetiibacter larvae]
MSDDKTPAPSRRDRFRPLELLVMSAVFGVFVGVFVLMGTRSWTYEDGWVLPLVMAGVAFIVSLVVLATLLIAVGPKDEQRIDPADPDAPSGSAGSVHRDPRGH